MFGAQKAGVYGAVAVLGLFGGVLDPITGLLGGDSGSSSGATRPTAAQWKTMGSTWAKWKRTLASGCHSYRYTYTVKPPAAAGKQWELETFLVGPRGGHLGSDVIIGGADPKHGAKSWRICRSNTVPGTFTINARLSYKIDPDEYSGSLKARHFRLVRP